MASFVRFGLIAPALAVLCGGGCAAIGFGSAEDSPPSPGTFVAALEPTGGQGEASGEAEFRFDGATVEYAINISGIADAMGAHIHHGDSRIVIVPFRIALLEEDSTDVLIEGSFAAEDVSVSSPVTFNELLNLMSTGGAYVNVHTEANPAGAIRGPIRATPPAAPDGSGP